MKPIVLIDDDEARGAPPASRGANDDHTGRDERDRIGTGVEEETHGFHVACTTGQHRPRGVVESSSCIDGVTQVGFEEPTWIADRFSSCASLTDHEAGR